FGSLGGIYTAVAARSEPVLCVAWDMPFVPSELLRALVDGATAGKFDAFLPESSGRRGLEPLCAVYGPACRAAIERRLDKGDLKAISFHADDMDQKGKDTWRHWHEGKAERVLMESPGQRVLFERTAEQSDPITLARRYLSEADIVLVEGFTRAPLPKIEVYRTVAGPKPIVDEAVHDPADRVAMVTDDRALHAPFPVFRFTDTACLVTTPNVDSAP